MLFRRLSNVVSCHDSLFKVRITGNLSEAALTSFLVLGRLDKFTLERSLHSFRSSLFKDLSKLPSYLAPILKEPLNSPYDELFSKLIHIREDVENSKTIEINAFTVAESLKVAYEFLDKAKLGFLSGDFTIELMERLINHLGLLEKTSIEENHDFLRKLEEYIREQNFCLPKYGISNPLSENPQALYIREAFIERDSPEILMKNLKNDTQILTHGAFSLNFLTPKEHLVDIHANLASIIRMEQINSLRKKHPSFSKSYSTILVIPI